MLVPGYVIEYLLGLVGDRGEKIAIQKTAKNNNEAFRSCSRGAIVWCRAVVKKLCLGKSMRCSYKNSAEVTTVAMPDLNYQKEN